MIRLRLSCIQKKVVTNESSVHVTQKKTEAIKIILN